MLSGKKTLVKNVLKLTGALLEEIVELHRRLFFSCLTKGAG